MHVCVIAAALVIAVHAASQLAPDNIVATDKSSCRATESLLIQLQGQPRVLAQLQCENAQSGDECHEHIMWAKQTGIIGNPEGYPGLSAASSNKDFQLFLHGIGMCPEPCVAAPPAPSPQAGSAAAPYCGIAVNIYECRAEVNRLKVINQAVGESFERMCMGYGGTHPPAHQGKTDADKDSCTLNINNDCDHWFEASGSWHCARDYGLSKNPDACRGRYLFLWDEPMTQGKSAEWAADQWKEHVDAWSPQIRALRARGTRITTPLFTDHGGPATDKFQQFFERCGHVCSDPHSKYYIDVLATNQWLLNPQSAHSGQEQWIKEYVAGLRQANGNRPVILGNFAWLGASTADEQAAAIATSRIWDRSWSGLEAVFYFAATDYGGGTTNNFLFSATSSGSTVADALVSRCQVYNR